MVSMFGMILHLAAPYARIVFPDAAASIILERDALAPTSFGSITNQSATDAQVVEVPPLDIVKLEGNYSSRKCL